MGRVAGGGIRGGNAYEQAHGLPPGSVDSRDPRYKAWAKKKAVKKPKVVKRRSAPDLTVHDRIKFNAAFKPPTLMAAAKQTFLFGPPGGLAPPPGVNASRAVSAREVIDLTKEAPSRQQKGGRASTWRSKIQACGCRYDDGTPIGAKVLKTKGGRLYYTCGYAKVNGSGLGLGGFRCVTSQTRFIKFVETQNTAKEMPFF